jgi:hypothetical protein
VAVRRIISYCSCLLLDALQSAITRSRKLFIMPLASCTAISNHKKQDCACAQLCTSVHILQSMLTRWLWHTHCRCLISGARNSY